MAAGDTRIPWLQLIVTAIYLEVVSQVLWEAFYTYQLSANFDAAGLLVLLGQWLS